MHASGAVQARHDVGQSSSSSSLQPSASASVSGPLCQPLTPVGHWSALVGMPSPSSSASPVVEDGAPLEPNPLPEEETAPPENAEDAPLVPDPAPKEEESEAEEAELAEEEDAPAELGGLAEKGADEVLVAPELEMTEQALPLEEDARPEDDARSPLELRTLLLLSSITDPAELDHVVPPEEDPEPEGSSPAPGGQPVNTSTHRRWHQAAEGWAWEIGSNGFELMGASSWRWRLTERSFSIQ